MHDPYAVHIVLNGGKALDPRAPRPCALAQSQKRLSIIFHMGMQRLRINVYMIVNGSITENKEI